jgi:hypothetical protein
MLTARRQTATASSFWRRPAVGDAEVVVHRKVVGLESSCSLQHGQISSAALASSRRPKGTSFPPALHDPERGHGQPEASDRRDSSGKPTRQKSSVLAGPTHPVSRSAMSVTLFVPSTCRRVTGYVQQLTPGGTVSIRCAGRSGGTPAARTSNAVLGVAPPTASGAHACANRTPSPNVCWISPASTVDERVTLIIPSSKRVRPTPAASVEARRRTLEHPSTSSHAIEHVGMPSTPSNERQGLVRWRPTSALEALMMHR